MKKNFIRFAVTLGLTFFWIYSSQAADILQMDTTGKKGGKLVLSLEGNPKTFNPHMMDDTSTTKAFYNMVYIGLNSYNHATGEMENELAKSMTVSPDAKTFTFILREGLKWPDGVPFTADDVVFSWNALTDPNTTSNLKENFTSSTGELPKIEKVSENTIRFLLPETNVLFAGDLDNFKILPKHKWQNALDSKTFMNVLLTNENVANVFGMGPYVLKKYVPDQVLIYERNPNYFKIDKNGTQLPYLDKVIRLITPDFQASFVKVRNKEIDMYELQMTDVDLMNREAESLGMTVYSLGASMDTVYYNFNLNPRKNADGKPYVNPDKLKIFADKRFRQALNYATDREGIIKVAYLGNATPLHSFDSPTNKFWYSDDLKKYPFDLEKAKSMLDEMGLKDLDGDGFRDIAPGKPFQFTIKTNVENKIRISVATLLKGDFAKIGIKCEINPIPFNSLLDNLSNDFDYEAVVMGWGKGVPPDPLSGKNIFLSFSSLHQWNAKSPEPAYEFDKKFDELTYKMSGTVDINERKKLWHEFSVIWQEELPQTMIVAVNKNLVVKNTLKNVKPSVLTPYFTWNIEEIYDDTVTP